MKVIHLHQYIGVLFLLIGNTLKCQYQAYLEPENRTINTDYVVGATNGGLSVNSRGEAVYMIPVYISPGTAGMAPEINLLYNSNYGDGPLGYGWTITGLSAIQRVPHNFYHDNTRKGIALATSDRFSLDSNRLILSSGNYGGDQSVYKTEIESFSRITAKGSAGNGPSWFLVETKDGKTIEYGNTSDSKVEANGTATVYQWRVNKITDRYGNYMKYTYNEINGESYLSRIDYTGNGTGIQPYNALKFFYNARNDINGSYVAGKYLPSTVVLTSIRMESEDSLVREYHLKYFSDENNKSRLNEVQEKGNDGSSLNSTVFGWTQTGFAFSQGDVFTPSQVSRYYFGDFNGDGRRDFIRLQRKTTYLSTDTWKVYLSNSTGSGFSLISSGVLGAGYKGIIVADQDGDGMDNFFIHRTTNYLAYAFENYKYDPNQGTVIRNAAADLIFDEVASVNTIVGDFDGDNRTDLLLLDVSYNYFAASGITIATGGIPSFNTPDVITTMDFDGDGREEILVIRNSNSNIYQYDNLNQVFTSVYSSASFPTKDDRIFIGDFNGDQKDDLLSYSNGWMLKFSTGTAFATSGIVPALRNYDPAASLLDNNYYTGDFNGDGMDDILEAYKSGSSSILKTHFSYGNGQTTLVANTYSKAAINQDYLMIGDFSGTGFDQVFYYDYSLSTNKVNLVSFLTGNPPSRINKIYDGLDNKIKIEYNRINSDTSFYKYNEWGSLYPKIILKNSHQAVSSVSRSGGVVANGTEADISVTYSYGGLTIHRQGKNNLGFSLVKEHNSGTGRSSVTRYTFDPIYFFISRKEVFDSEFAVDPLYTTIWSKKEFGNKVILPYVSSYGSYDPLSDIRSVTGYTLDNYGNVTNITKTSRKPHLLPEYTESSNYGGFSSYGNWGVPNKPQTNTISRRIAGQSAVTKTVNITYDSNGRILTEITFPGTSKELSKTYSYNNYGNPESATVSAAGLTPRISTYQYDNKNRFIIEIERPDTNTVSYSRDLGTGNILTETAIDSKVTTYQYDAFGRLMKIITPLGHEIVESIDWVTDMPAMPIKYKVNEAVPGRPEVTNYYDKQGRIIRTESESTGGNVIQDRFYNQDGTLAKITYPYRYGDQLRWIEYGYDEYGRKISEDNNSLITTYYYGKDTIKVTYPTNETKTTVFNSQSQVVQVIDNVNTSANYSYNSYGFLRSITTAGNSVNYYYDAFGLQDSSFNKNSGGIKFTHNAYGELVSQRDARGYLTTFQYDVLGRITQRTTPEGTSFYNYYHSGNGIGQLAVVIGPGGVSESYTYDSFGRVSQYSRSIQNEITMSFNYSYDQYGNNTSVTYPSGIIIQNTYDQYGNLSAIRRNDESLIWELNSVSASGNPVNVSLGPGTLVRNYEYDGYENLSSILSGEWRQTFNFNGASGNLMGRSYMNSDSTFMKSESFLYDSRNRLTTTQVTGQSQKSVTYDQTGNILTKTDAGTYYYYSNNVNALASVTFLHSGITTEPQTIAYNSQNKVTEMSEGDCSYNVLYGANGERIKSRLYENSVLSKTIYYSPGYEKITTTGGTVENHYIVSPFGLEAIIAKTGTTETLYLAETDHLGSLIGLFDTSGVHVERYSYDAWGRRRNPSDWTFLNVPAPVITERGFTGHEHLDKFRLINMNGRMYDPVTGRFLNADPVIDNSGGAQGLNSYTYVLNNPLKYTDPSGYIKAAPPEQGVIVNPGWLRYAGYGHYSSAWFQQEFGAGSGGGGGGGMYGKPGQDGNGTGLGGIYYDHVSGTYRDANNYHAVNQEIFTNVIENYRDAEVTELIFAGLQEENPWERLIGYTFSDGQTYYYHDAAGGGANAWDYISNGASVASGYPTISGTWAYNTSGDVAWTGKNGNYYKLSQVKNNGGYVKSMNYAKNASRLTRGLGNGLTGLSMATSVVSTSIAVANGTDNTSTWTNAAIGIGGGVLTIVGAPVVVTGAAIVGVVWGVGQLFYGDEINGWIDNNFGYR